MKNKKETNCCNCGAPFEEGHNHCLYCKTMRDEILNFLGNSHFNGSMNYTACSYNPNRLVSYTTFPQYSDYRREF